MKIAIDFDGTCVKHMFPEVGEDVPFAVDVLRLLVSKGHKLILYTMRSDMIGSDFDVEDPTIHPHGADYLSQAVGWFNDRGIKLYGIQKDPGQEKWTESNKCYAEMYIDDAALGCPLVYSLNNERPYVDWMRVAAELKQRNLL